MGSESNRGITCGWTNVRSPQMIRQIITAEAEAAGINPAIRDRVISAVVRRNRGRVEKPAVMYRQELIAAAEQLGECK